jgi:uncharacterized integral membrane protein
VSPAQHSGDPERREGLDEEHVRRLGLIGALVIVVVLALVFIVENSNRVEVSFVFFTADISLIWVIVLSMVVGAIAAFVIKRLVRRRFVSGSE